MEPDKISTFLEDVYTNVIPKKTIEYIKTKWTELEFYDYVSDSKKLCTGNFVRLVKLNMEEMHYAGIIVKITLNKNKSVKNIYLKENKKIYCIIPAKYFVFQIKPEKNGLFGKRLLRDALKKMSGEDQK